MRSTFKVLFYLKCNAPKKDGLIPVMCRITINGKIAQFSCKLDVEEKSWNVELGRVSGRSIAAQETNRMLDKIRVGINQAYQKIADRDNYVTAEKVRNAYLGLGMNHETLLAVFRQHNEDYGKQVGKLKSPRSYWKYCTMYKHLSEFVEKRYKVSDIAFKELTPAFITDFELFLRVEKNHCNNTVWSYMMPFRKIIYMAVNNGSTRTARKQASKRISGCWTLPDTSSRNTTAWPKGTNCCQFPVTPTARTASKQ